LFQALLGTLRTRPFVTKSRHRASKFQALLGTLRTRLWNVFIKNPAVFQALLGTLRTFAHLTHSPPPRMVSSPLRYSTNVCSEGERRNSDQVSSPLRYSTNHVTSHPLTEDQCVSSPLRYSTNNSVTVLSTQTKKRFKPS